MKFILTSDSQTNTVISRRLCLPVKMASETVKRSFKHGKMGMTVLKAAEEATSRGFPVFLAPTILKLVVANLLHSQHYL